MALEITFILVSIQDYSFDFRERPKFRTHLIAIFAVRLILIAILFSFVAFMSCDPVEENEEVGHLLASLPN